MCRVSICIAGCWLRVLSRPLRSRYILDLSKGCNIECNGHGFTIGFHRGAFLRWCGLLRHSNGVHLKMWSLTLAAFKVISSLAVNSGKYRLDLRWEDVVNSFAAKSVSLFVNASPWREPCDITTEIPAASSSLKKFLKWKVAIVDFLLLCHGDRSLELSMRWRKKGWRWSKKT